MSFNLNSAFNGKQENIVSILPLELCLEILSFLTGPELSSICLVNKEWSKIARSDLLWMDILERNSFGAVKWSKYGGDVGKVDPLPKTILNDLRKSAINPVIVWCPKTLNNSPFTFRALCELIEEKCLPDTKFGCLGVDTKVKDLIGEIPMERGGWFMMSKKVIKGSSYKHWEEKQLGVIERGVKTGIHFEIPRIIEATLSVFAQFMQTGSEELLFGHMQWAHTGCKEKVGDLICYVGTQFYGLIVYDNESCNAFGIAPVVRY